MKRSVNISAECSVILIEDLDTVGIPCVYRKDQPSGHERVHSEDYESFKASAVYCSELKDI